MKGRSLDMRVYKFCALALAAMLGWAGGARADSSSAQAALRGPVSGYVLDAGSRAIRPVNGLLGAALLGTALPLPFPVSAAAISSERDLALVVSGSEDRGLYLVRGLGSATPSVAPVPGALPQVERIVFNAADTAALAYSARDRRLQMIRGLPDNAAANPAADLSRMAGTVTALAVDAAGSTAVIATVEAAPAPRGRHSGRGALYWLRMSDPDSPPEPRLVSYFLAPSSLALLNQDRDVMVADAAASELALVRGFAGQGEVLRWAGERDGVSGPAALNVSADGRRLFVANAGDRSLVVFDLAARSAEARLALDAVPTRLERLPGRSTFLLNEAGGEPLLVLEAGQSPAVYFVPARQNE